MRLRTPSSKSCALTVACAAVRSASHSHYASEESKLTKPMFFFIDGCLLSHSKVRYRRRYQVFATVTSSR